MNLYLAGTMSRPYVFNEWTSIWQERTGKPKSSKKKSGGGQTMNIYLAGGILGNLQPDWKRLAQKINGGGGDK